ncbi:MAG: response regulator transcription factor [Bacteroidetes bacterium]|nr:response regulator transcription factor [Bacteroidota bacterium]
MKILILEDEAAAAKRISKMIKELLPGCDIMATLESVRTAVSFLKQYTPDLILADIQLADGISLDVFAQTTVNTPVIFTTAYDEYTLKAFKLNSIDYLLKPIDKIELGAAIKKYEQLHLSQRNDAAENLRNTIQQLMQKQEYRSRFMVKAADKLLSVTIDETAYLRADNKIVFLYTFQQQRHIVDETLEEIEQTLNPKLFFRINRSYIIHIGSIDRVENHFNGRLHIMLKHCSDTDIFVSRERVKDFKNWLNQ